MMREVTPDEMFEILCADCLRDEPFPREIQVVGQATGWAERIRQKAAARNVTITVTIQALDRKEGG